jgi:hypothetical protein
MKNADWLDLIRRVLMHILYLKTQFDIHFVFGQTETAGCLLCDQLLGKLEETMSDRHLVAVTNVMCQLRMIVLVELNE